MAHRNFQFQGRDINNSDLGLARFANDLSIYDHPSDKKRTVATTAKMRRAEAALLLLGRGGSRHVPKNW